MEVIKVANSKKPEKAKKLNLMNFIHNMRI